MNILVTGGAGYIGSHTTAQLLDSGYNVIVLDNLSNSSVVSLQRVQSITRRTLTFIEGDIRDSAVLEKIFNQHSIEVVIHFAGLKAVGESTQVPLKFYDNNVAGTLNLCEVMTKHDCKKIVFSSSATVYDEPPPSVPIKEDFPTRPTNPYGRSKLMVEELLGDLFASDSEWSIVLLRYFNPVGAHESGLIGEAPNDLPNNLLPYISQVAIGKLKQLSVLGSNYPTIDGTGVRDYIHVVDLAEGHLKALDKIKSGSGLVTYNLGTGNGYSVLEVVMAFELASGVTIPYQLADRRPGDIAECCADPSLAKEQLGWQAKKGIDEMMRDIWNWQQKNPEGYLK